MHRRDGGEPSRCSNFLFRKTGFELLLRSSRFSPVRRTYQSARGRHTKVLVKFDEPGRLFAGFPSRAQIRQTAPGAHSPFRCTTVPAPEDEYTSFRAQGNRVLEAVPE